jgi:Mrp family chromosome partitioning ATPase
MNDHVFADDVMRQEVRRVLTRLQGKGGSDALTAHSPLLVTSAASGEGKSTFAALLAVLAAREFGLRTVIVDLNWVAPAVHSAFDVEANYDLADLLTHGAERYLHGSGLDAPRVLTAPRNLLDANLEQPAPRRRRRMSWTAVKQFTPGLAEADQGTEPGRLRLMRQLQALAARMDLVIFDGPAVYPDILGPLDALQLAAAAKSVLVVVEMRATARDLVKRAALALNSHSTLLGSIMNQRSNRLA